MDRLPAVLSTDSVPASHRKPYWADLVCDTFVELGCGGFSGENFYGRIESVPFDQSRISQVRSTKHVVERTPRHIARSSSSDMLVSVQVVGRALLRQGGREAILNPGDFAIYDVTRPYALGFDSEFQQLVLQVPREQLAGRLFQMDELTAVRVSGENGVGRLASMLILQMADQYKMLGEAATRQAQASALDLLAHALCVGQSKLSYDVSESQNLTVRRILGYIEQHLEDAGLSCERVARDNGISERYLRKLFQSRGHTVSDWMWQRRLEHAREDILNPLFLHRSITTIAYNWGFKDTAHFSRAFRRRFDASPRDTRATLIRVPVN
ncbi:MAG: AraC family transcriptional regulator [Bradyrhizobium sp.]|nr:AraC family transcriptional regulator [Bradyrhizobium sp.]